MMNAQSRASLTRLTVPGAITLPPFAAAAFAVLLLNILLMVQRAREQSKSWRTRFLRDLRHWDGRLPDDHDKHVHT